MTGLVRSESRAIAPLLAEGLFRLVTVTVTLVAVVAVVTSLEARARLVESPSGTWETVGGIALRLFVASFVGRHLIRKCLPLYVAHGRTRHQFMRQGLLAGTICAAAAAAVMTAGLVTEGTVHQGLDWPHQPALSHLFQAPSQFGLVFTGYWLLFAVWAMAGALMEAAKYNRYCLSIIRLPVTVALVVAAESAVGTPLPFGLRFDTSPPVAVATLVCAVVIAAGLALTWAVVRESTIDPQGERRA